MKGLQKKEVEKLTGVTGVGTPAFIGPAALCKSCEDLPPSEVMIKSLHPWLSSMQRKKNAGFITPGVFLKSLYSGVLWVSIKQCTSQWQEAIYAFLTRKTGAKSFRKSLPFLLPYKSFLLPPDRSHYSFYTRSILKNPGRFNKKLKNKIINYCIIKTYIFIYGRFFLIWGPKNQAVSPFSKLPAPFFEKSITIYRITSYGLSNPAPAV